MDSGFLPDACYCNEMLFTHAKWVSAFIYPSYIFAMSVTNSEDGGKEMLCSEAFKKLAEGDNASTHVIRNKILENFGFFNHCSSYRQAAEKKKGHRRNLYPLHVGEFQTS